jgi:hypothetical protein
MAVFARELTVEPGVQGLQSGDSIRKPHKGTQMPSWALSRNKTWHSTGRIALRRAVVGDGSLSHLTHNEDNTFSFQGT